MTKSEARAAAKAVRATCDPAWGAAMAAHVCRECRPPRGAIVGGFFPLPGEIDTRHLLTALAVDYQIGLPETPPRGQNLRFRQWRPGDRLVIGRFGTQYSEGAVLRPDFVLVPLLAFDARGNRLGYGGGYYDRIFAALPDAFRLGCAFAAQEIVTVPTSVNDVPLHAVATELGIMRF